MGTFQNALGSIPGGNTQPPPGFAQPFAGGPPTMQPMGFPSMPQFMQGGHQDGPIPVDPPPGSLGGGVQRGVGAPGQAMGMVPNLLSQMPNGAVPPWLPQQFQGLTPQGAQAMMHSPQSVQNGFGQGGFAGYGPPQFTQGGFQNFRNALQDWRSQRPDFSFNSSSGTSMGDQRQAYQTQLDAWRDQRPSPFSYLFGNTPPGTTPPTMTPGGGTTGAPLQPTQVGMVPGVPGSMATNPAAAAPPAPPPSPYFPSY
jgi:hypothetical protein